MNRPPHLGGVRRKAANVPSFEKSRRSLQESAAEKKYKDYRAAFKRYDINGDGRLDIWEIKQVFKDVGIQPSEDDIKQITQAIDNSNEDGLTFEEFVSVMEKEHGSKEEGDERETLEAWVALGGSLDHTGSIDSDKLKKIINDFSLTVNIDELLELLDSDGSGQIEYDEFRLLFSDDLEDESGSASSNNDGNNKNSGNNDGSNGNNGADGNNKNGSNKGNKDGTGNNSSSTSLNSKISAWGRQFNPLSTSSYVKQIDSEDEDDTNQNSNYVSSNINKDSAVSTVQINIAVTNPTE